MATNTALAQISRSKELPWYRPNIGSRLTPEVQRFFEVYSGIPSDEVAHQIYEVRDGAWEIFPWPCVGGFWFVSFGLSKHRQYATIIARLRSGHDQEETEERFLDLGTCLGQDLRRLIYDGVPAACLYGVDILPTYEELGYQLFGDGNKGHPIFIAADLLADDDDDDDDDDVDVAKPPRDPRWASEILGKMTIVHASMFLHLFDLATQVRACCRIIRLLSGKPGDLVLGSQCGSRQSTELLLRPPFASSSRKSLYYHDIHSFRRMWDDVGSATNTKWNVTVDFEERARRQPSTIDGTADDDEGVSSYFPVEGSGHLHFTVERA